MNSESKIQQTSTKIILAPKCSVKGINDKLTWFHVMVWNCPGIIALLPCKYLPGVTTELSLFVLIFVSAIWALVTTRYGIYCMAGWRVVFPSSAIIEPVLLMSLSCGCEWHPKDARSLHITQFNFRDLCARGIPVMLWLQKWDDCRSVEQGIVT